ncbi:MAG: potassium transporter [marine bacterium B5-7]|nr:MAG: potassium transporter [marine bacterium B5-7]
MALLNDILIFLVAAIVIVPLGKRLGLSSVLGFLLAGLIIGPAVLGLIDDPDAVLQFAELGVVLLLFIIGLELQPRRLWVMRRLVFGLGTLQLMITTVIIVITLLSIGLSLATALIIGFALSLSSTAFVLQLLGEQKKLNRPHGRAAFGVLLLQDIAVIPAIAILNAIASARGEDMGHGFDPLYLVIVIVALIAARFLLRPALRFIAGSGVHELFAAAGLAIVIGAASAMEVAGLSMGLGAFIAGMMVADSEYRYQIETDVTPYKGLLLGLFFIAVGMSVNLGLLAEQPLSVIVLAVTLVTIKALVLLPLCRVFKLSFAESFRGALILSQGGEFAFVLLTAGGAAGLVTTQYVELAILVVTLSMVTTPFAVALGDRLLGMKQPTRRFDEIEGERMPVVIAGFGRFGQIIARVLSMRKIPFTALESSPAQVDFVRQFGSEIYYGDATRLDLLQNAQVGSASAFVIAVDDPEDSLRIARLVRQTYPSVNIMARARNRRHELMLRELGVKHVIRDTLLSSLSLTENLLRNIGFSREEAELSVRRFREHDQRTLDRQASVMHDADAFRETTLDAARELNELFNEDARANQDDNG